MDGLKKGVGSFIPLPYKTNRKKSMVATLEGTKLERSGKGNVPGFLVCSGKVMRREGREKQIIQNMCAAFQDGVVEQKAFLTHGQEHDRSITFSETLCDLYCFLTGFMYCMSVTLSWELIDTESCLECQVYCQSLSSALYQKTYFYISSLTDSK